MLSLPRRRHAPGSGDVEAQVREVPLDAAWRPFVAALSRGARRRHPRLYDPAIARIALSVLCGAALAALLALRLVPSWWCDLSAADADALCTAVRGVTAALARRNATYFLCYARLRPTAIASLLSVHFLKRRRSRCVFGQGGVLGALRHGGRPVPWDGDVDLCVFERDRARVLAALHEMVGAHPGLYLAPRTFGAPVPPPARRTLFQIKRAALHSYGPGPHSCAVLCGSLTGRARCAHAHPARAARARRLAAPRRGPVRRPVRAPVAAAQRGHGVVRVRLRRQRGRRPAQGLAAPVPVLGRVPAAPAALLRRARGGPARGAPARAQPVRRRVGGRRGLRRQPAAQAVDVPRGARGWVGRSPIRRPRRGRRGRAAGPTWSRLAWHGDGGWTTSSRNRNKNSPSQTMSP